MNTQHEAMQSCGSSGPRPPRVWKSSLLPLLIYRFSEKDHRAVSDSTDMSEHHLKGLSKDIRAKYDQDRGRWTVIKAD